MTDGIRCFLYELKKDGLHVYEGTYWESDDVWDDVSGYFESDGDDELTINFYKHEYDDNIIMMDKRNDEDAKSELQVSLKESIEALQDLLSCLEKGIIIEGRS